MSPDKTEERHGLLGVINNFSENTQRQVANWEGFVASEHKATKQVRAKLCEAGYPKFNRPNLEDVLLAMYQINGDENTPFCYNGGFYELTHALMPNAITRRYISTGLSDRAGEIFNTQRYYHVTSTQALENMARGQFIRPWVVHEKFQIKTHRGIGLKILDLLLFFSGEDYTRKNEFVWCSKTPDPQQFEIEQQICQQGHKIDQKLFEIFFDIESGKNGNDFVLNPDFKKLLEAIYENGKLFLDPKLQEYTLGILDQISTLTGLRGFWYQTLKNIFTGKAKFEANDNQRAYYNGRPEHRFPLGEHLLKLANKDIPHNPSPNDGQHHDACIIEIDPQKALALTAINGVNLIAVSRRHPSLLLPLTLIHPDAITKVYCKTDEHIASDAQNFFNDRLSLMSLLPAPPLDPINPICLHNYDFPFFSAWSNAFKNGLFSPLFLDYGRTVNQILNSFGPNFFGENVDYISPNIFRRDQHPAQWIYEANPHWFWQLRTAREDFNDGFLGLEGVYTI